MAAVGSVSPAANTKGSPTNITGGPLGGTADKGVLTTLAARWLYWGLGLRDTCWVLWVRGS